MKDRTRRMLAEWEPQSAVQLTWPHENTDWAPILPDITAVYKEIAREISKREQLIVVAPENALPQDVNCKSAIINTNDTWARDHGFITVVEESPLKTKNSELKTKKLGCEKVFSHPSIQLRRPATCTSPRCREARRAAGWGRS